MSSDEAIKAALREAREAVAREHCPRPCAAGERCLCAEDSAAAIEAFLRGLPDPYAPGGLDFWEKCPLGTSPVLWVAAAVARAAQEARDGE